MATIHFSSGKTRDIDSGKLDKFVIDLKGRGIKMMVNRGEECTLIVPLNSNTMEFIEEFHEPVIIDETIEESDEPAPTLDELAEAIIEAKADVDSKKDKEELEKEKLDEMMAKSSCLHPAEGMITYRHDTKKGSRFFPVCSFCGKRERYVKADTLSDEEKGAAKIWED
jgi:hypothetical protein